MSVVLARFPLLLPVRNSFASYGASAVTRTSDRGDVAEAINQYRSFGVSDNPATNNYLQWTSHQEINISSPESFSRFFFPRVSEEKGKRGSCGASGTRKGVLRLHRLHIAVRSAPGAASARSRLPALQETNPPQWLE